jgi:alginate O-acetyltransferase complex protein AlgI
MFFEPSFWILIAAAFAALQFLPADAVGARAAVLALLGAVGLALVLKVSVIGASILALSVLFIWLGCRRLTTHDSRDALGIALLAIAPLLVAWLIGKVAIAFSLQRFAPILFVGISFLLVKSWSLLKDIMDGKVRDIHPAEVMAYLLHLPTFVIGPMHYFEEFRASLRRPYVLTMETSIDCLFRFVLGLVKVYALAGLLAPASLIGLAERESNHLTAILAGAFVYSFVLYFDFSGFCDMATAVSRLLGIDVPKNFNWPYLAPSIRDFWRRWHITFTRALMAHVFVPLTRNLQRRWPKSPRFVASTGYAVTFLACGFWHGATANFLIWGLWHACGLIVQDNWQRQRPRKIKPTAAKFSVQTAIATGLTFIFVSIGWIFFVLPLDKLAHVKVW